MEILTGVLFWRTAMALLLMGFVLGCGGSKATGPVAHWQGKVTIKGQPVPADAKGRISFIPSRTGENRNARPAIVEIVNSAYDAPEVPVGPLTVTFDITRLTGREIARGGGAPLKETENLLPPEHAQGLDFEVEEGAKAHDFAL